MRVIIKTNKLTTSTIAWYFRWLWYALDRTRLSVSHPHSRRVLIYFQHAIRKSQSSNWCSPHKWTIAVTSLIVADPDWLNWNNILNTLVLYFRTIIYRFRIAGFWLIEVVAYKSISRIFWYPSYLRGVLLRVPGDLYPVLLALCVWLGVGEICKIIAGGVTHAYNWMNTSLYWWITLMM